MKPDELRSLSDLLDQAIDLPPEAREPWLAGLQGESLLFAPTLRELLAKHASRETGDLIGQLPQFTAPGAEEATSEFQPGAQIGPYRLLREIGRGGMGEVWLAERADGALKRQVALKLPMLSVRRSVLVQRFARERDILATLEHPNIARLYDAGLADGGQPYLALEYVEGLPIDMYCRERGFDLRARLALLLQVADAVAFAHSRLVLHRDLKPGNVLVTAAGQVRLLDFGIAKLMEGDRAHETVLTQASGRALTLDYASPEQIRGEAIGTASDVYSLSVLAFELLAGERPYRVERGSAAEIEEAILAQDAPLASSLAQTPAARQALRGDLDAILNKALKKNPAERYPTVQALAQDWHQHLEGRRVLARPDTLAYRLARFARRHRWPLASGGVIAAAFGLALGFGAVALVILALLIGLGAALAQARRARQQSRLAHAESRKAEAVKRFLLDLFEANSHDQADPLQAQQTTARELLDIGVQRVDEALRDEPESRLEVLGSLAGLYWQIGLRADAGRLYQSATALARSSFGAHDTRFARIAMQCARALSTGPDRKAVPALLAQANEALLASRLADSPDRVYLLHELASHRHHEALGTFVHTAEEAAALAPRINAGPETANVCRLAGRAQLCAGRYDLAEAHYRRALAVPAAPGERVGAPNINGLAELGETLFKQGRVTQAVLHLRQAVEISQRLHGAGHRWTMVLQMRLSNVLVASGAGEEALALRAEVEQHLAEPRPEYDAQFRADLSGYLAIALFERGRLDLALPYQRVDVEDLRLYFAGSQTLADAELKLAEAELAYGRADEAAALFEAARACWQRYAGGHEVPARGAMYGVLGARLARARGDPASALAEAEQLALPDSAALGRFHPATLQLVAERSCAETANGRAEAGLARVDAELLTLRQHLGAARLPGVEARLLRAKAEARQALGDLAGAESDWAALVSLRLRHDDAASLWLADDQIGWATCLAGLDRHSQARAHADAAATIFAVHPGPAPHHLQPLERLQQRLA